MNRIAERCFFCTGYADIQNCNLQVFYEYLKVEPILLLANLFIGDRTLLKLNEIQAIGRHEQLYSLAVSFCKECHTLYRSLEFEIQKSNRFLSFECILKCLTKVGALLRMSNSFYENGQNKHEKAHQMFRNEISTRCKNQESWLSFLRDIYKSPGTVPKKCVKKGILRTTVGAIKNTKKSSLALSKCLNRRYTTKNSCLSFILRNPHQRRLVCLSHAPFIPKFRRFSESQNEDDDLLSRRPIFAALKMKFMDTASFLAKLDDCATTLLVDPIVGFRTLKINESYYHPNATQTATLKTIIKNLKNRQDFERTFHKFILEGWFSEFNPFKHRHAIWTHVLRYMAMYDRNSGYRLEPCKRYSGDLSRGVKVTATKAWAPNEKIALLTACSGLLIEGKDDYVNQENGNMFSVMANPINGKVFLWLGPARFCNHDCKSNSITRTFQPTIARIEVRRKIKAGAEIFTHYGAAYFGEKNKDCECESCHLIGEQSESLNLKPCL